MVPKGVDPLQYLAIILPDLNLDRASSGSEITMQALDLFNERSATYNGVVLIMKEQIFCFSPAATDY